VLAEAPERGMIMHIAGGGRRREVIWEMSANLFLPAADVYCFPHREAAAMYPSRLAHRVFARRRVGSSAQAPRERFLCSESVGEGVPLARRW
jgi:hypothetical protein